MSKKLTIYCIISFLFGVIISGWAVLILARGTSELWTTNYVLQMGSRHEFDARSAYSNGNKTQARDLMNSALLARRYLQNEADTAIWPIDMPLTGMFGRTLGLVDLNSMARSVNSKNQLLFFECAVLALSEETADANSRFQSIQKQFPNTTREKCIVLGTAFLKPAP